MKQEYRMDGRRVLCDSHRQQRSSSIVCIKVKPYCVYECVYATSRNQLLCMYYCRASYFSLELAMCNV